MSFERETDHIQCYPKKKTCTLFQKINRYEIGEPMKLTKVEAFMSGTGTLKFLNHGEEFFAGDFNPGTVCYYNRPDKTVRCRKKKEKSR